MKKTLLLLDFNNLLYRSVFGHQGLSHRGVFTGGMFGFIDMVSSAVNRYTCDRVVVCLDSKPYSRTKFYPAYKSDRAQSSLNEAGQMQVSVARRQITKFIEAFRLPLAANAGMEADDLIGEFCKDSIVYERIIIMSNDSDLYQLLNGRVFLAMTGGLYGLRNFLDDWPGMLPAQWPRCVALKGSHNGVEGIRGVGDKTAYKAVRERITDAEVWTRWRVRRAKLQLHTQLATFPFPLVRRPHLPSVRYIKYSLQKLEEECERYGIKCKTEFHDAFLRLAS